MFLGFFLSVVGSCQKFGQNYCCFCQQFTCLKGGQDKRRENRGHLGIQVFSEGVEGETISHRGLWSHSHLGNDPWKGGGMDTLDNFRGDTQLVCP